MSLPYILIKKELFEKVKRGEKTSTLRLRRPPIQIGKVGHIKCGPRKQVRIKVLAMELMELSEVTGKVLKSEGVSSKTELIKILKNCYPNQVISKLWLISFRKLKDA